MPRVGEAGYRVNARAGSADAGATGGKPLRETWQQVMVVGSTRW